MVKYIELLKVWHYWDEPWYAKEISIWYLLCKWYDCPSSIDKIQKQTSKRFQAASGTVAGSPGAASCNGKAQRASLCQVNELVSASGSQGPSTILKGYKHHTSYLSEVAVRFLILFALALHAKGANHRAILEIFSEPQAKFDLTKWQFGCHSKSIGSHGWIYLGYMLKHSTLASLLKEHSCFSKNSRVLLC